MKKYIFSLLIALLSLPMFAQQQAQAKVILDKTASAFRNAGGVKAEFKVIASAKGKAIGESTGTIQLKGDKFVLKTPEGSTWFDGKTQWSYLAGSDEVNISNPTETELQSLNPYALLQIYQKGFTFRMGAVKLFRGKSVYEVILTANNKRQEVSRIVLYITRDSYQPVYILMEQRNKDRSEIEVTGYQTGMKYADSLFVFNKKQYPKAEIIDLR